MSKQFENLHEEIESLRRPQWSLWFPALALIVTIVTGLWYLSVQPIQAQIAHLSDKDAAQSEQTKLTNQRIDQLYNLYRDINAVHQQFMPRQKEK